MNETSYSLTLGSQFSFRATPTFSPSRGNLITSLNPSSEKDLCRAWGPFQEAELCSTKTHAEAYSLTQGDKFILIQPGRTILTHTGEFVGYGRQFVPLLEPHPSLTLLGATVTGILPGSGAGAVAPITLAITNSGPLAVVMAVGTPVVRISFACPFISSGGESGLDQETAERARATWTPERTFAAWGK